MSIIGFIIVLQTVNVKLTAFSCSETSEKFLSHGYDLISSSAARAFYRKNYTQLYILYICIYATLTTVMGSRNFPLLYQTLSYNVHYTNVLEKYVQYSCLNVHEIHY